MNILFISKFVPSPGYSGGSKRNLAWLRFLSSHQDVHMVGYEEINFISGNKYETDSLTKSIHSYKFKRSGMLNIIKYVLSIINRTPFITYQYYSKLIKKRIKRIIEKENIELIFCSELSSMQYISIFNSIPVMFDDHNIEYELVLRNSKGKGIVQKLLYMFEYKRMKKFERQSWVSSNLVSFVSERDKLIAQELSGIKNSIVIENTYLEAEKEELEKFARPTIVFVGTISWAPNKNGLSKFITEIYRDIMIEVCNVDFYVLGSSSTNEINELCKNNNIVILENVSEPKKNEILSRSWVGVIPLYSGSGTRIKAIEYWMHSLPVVSTDIGVEGLNPSKGTTIAYNNTEFTMQICEMLKSKKLCESKGKLNYDIFKIKYREDVVFNDTLYSSIHAELFRKSKGIKSS